MGGRSRRTGKKSKEWEKGSDMLPRRGEGELKEERGEEG